MGTLEGSQEGSLRKWREKQGRPALRRACQQVFLAPGCTQLRGEKLVTCLE